MSGLLSSAWSGVVLHKLNGRFPYNLIKMAVLPIEEADTTADIFHSTLLAAYKAVASVPTLADVLWQ
jgi:hypothetical protein